MRSKILTHQTRFCPGTDSDLEYYVRECGEILGISGKLATDRRDAKHILEYVLHQVVEFKKLNQVHGMFMSLKKFLSSNFSWLCFLFTKKCNKNILISCFFGDFFPGLSGL